MTPAGDQNYIVNWSMTRRSPCDIFKPHDIAGIRHVLTTAHTQGLSVIPHGAGHSYTDAALNTHGVVIDVTDMRRILSWNPERGIMQVESGVTLREMVRIALADRWWLAVTPSTAEATIGGCAAMNVNGKNAWKCGSFGEHVLSLTVLLANGQALTISPESDLQLFRAVIGSAGLLGIITAVTLQLQRVPSSQVDVLVQPAASIGEILSIFQEEQSADFLEGWVDGFATGRELGRGIVTVTRFSNSRERQRKSLHISDQFEDGLARCIGTVCRPVVKGSVRTANRAAYWWTQRQDRKTIRRRSLFESTFYPPAVYAGYRALLPWGVETFHVFVPHSQAEALFTEIVRRSQASDFMPLWCVIKQHRRDPFLLSYQVDGFSLEVNYSIAPQTVQGLHRMLRELMECVIAAGGRFYLAKDSLLTSALYRQSVGDTAVEQFLRLKQQYDPEMLFQSDLFRRLFQPPK